MTEYKVNALNDAIEGHKNGGEPELKRPEKIVKYLHVESEKDGAFIDYNGKPASKYFITLPYWIVRAYKPSHVKVEINAKHMSFSEMQKEENWEEAQKYFGENWLRKMEKMRKLNHNYILVATVGRSEEWFNSIEDYENYHKELLLLNQKYLKWVSGGSATVVKVREETEAATAFTDKEMSLPTSLGRHPNLTSRSREPAQNHQCPYRIKKYRCKYGQMCENENLRHNGMPPNFNECSVAQRQINGNPWKNERQVKWAEDHYEPAQKFCPDCGEPKDKLYGVIDKNDHMKAKFVCEKCMLKKRYGLIMTKAKASE